MHADNCPSQRRGPRRRGRPVKTDLPDRVSFRIDERMRNALKERCENDDSSPSQIFRRALKQYLFVQVPAVSLFLLQAVASLT
jgi:hypothetical protein